MKIDKPCRSYERKWYTVVWVGGVYPWVYRPLTLKELRDYGVKKQ
jgi:hypothetical protein